jgi:lipoprotein-anchoring transpeptidase ErfK/SrfK
VEGPHGLLLRRSQVRVARRIPRPRSVPQGARWIHLDLSEQVLVAYEDQRPVFATLFSGGQAGHLAPAGTFRVRHKHVSVTMDGSDDVVGWYEVQQVPWTQYYYRSYAIHGAYWHDDFGAPRSHGCTNLAPADARWLFRWTTPRLPGGRQTRHAPGSWIVTTP